MGADELENEDDDASGMLSGRREDPSADGELDVDGSGLSSEAGDSSTGGELDADGFGLSTGVGDSSLGDEEVGDEAGLSGGVEDPSAGGRLVASPWRPSSPKTGGSSFTGPPLSSTESSLSLPSSLKVVNTAGLFESIPEKHIRV